MWVENLTGTRELEVKLKLKHLPGVILPPPPLFRPPLLHLPKQHALDNVFFIHVIIIERV